MPEEPTSDVPPPPPGRRLRARDAVLTVCVATLLLVLFQGQAARNWGEQMDPGIGRDVVLAFGKPAGWVADRLPLADATDDVTNWIASEDDLGDAGGFDAATETTAPDEGGVPPVSPESFDPLALGEEAPKLELDKLLVTGDSLAMPTDVEIARRLAGDVEVVRDPHVGTGISKPGPVDWGKLSTNQVADEEPDAVVVFIGANDGFPIPVAGGKDVECCGPDWAAAYADRARRMMDTYRRDGAARVYWLTIPTPRDDDLAEITRAVNAAIDVASVPWRAQVRVIDLGEVFTPDDRFRSSIEVDGSEEIVREPDGLHLTPKGAEVAADRVLAAMERDFPSLR
jgi:lysophospholipase L1-like esterase